MNLEKFTERARGFLQSAQTVALRMNHQRITPAHVLKALLEDEQGMAAGLIAREIADAPQAPLWYADSFFGKALAPGREKATRSAAR